MAKDPSPGRSTGPNPPKTGRKSVTIDLDAEDVSKGGAKSGPAPGAANEPVQPTSTEPSAAKAKPSQAASEPVKAGPIKANAPAGKPSRGKAEAEKAKAADAPAKSGSSGASTQTAMAGKKPARKTAESASRKASATQSAASPKAQEARPASVPAQSSALSMLVAAAIGGIMALGGAVALDRLQILSIFGAGSQLPELQTQITGLKDDTGVQITDLKAQIAALPAPSGPDADDVAALGEKISQVEALLAQQDARLAQAEQPQAVRDLEAQLKTLESAVQAGAAGPDAGLAAIEQKLAGLEQAVAGVNQTIADVQDQAGSTASSAVAAVKPEIDRLGAAGVELAGRLSTLESGLVDPQTVAALDARVELLAGVVDKNSSPQTIAALKSALAAESLASAVAAGRPFAAELKVLQAGTDRGPDLVPIAPYAEIGLPDAAALAAEFETLIPSMSPIEPAPQTQPQPGNIGLVDRLLSSARKVVEVREAGPAAGGELMRLTNTVIQALTGNNLKAAQAAWQGLPDEARQASAGWAAKLEARLLADELAGSLRADALSRLAAAGAGEGQ